MEEKTRTFEVYPGKPGQRLYKKMVDEGDHLVVIDGKFLEAVRIPRETKLDIALTVNNDHGVPAKYNMKLHLRLPDEFPYQEFNRHFDEQDVLSDIRKSIDEAG